MKNILIRDIDESVIESWKQEAKRQGVSMQSLLKKTINDNAPKAEMSKEEILAKIDELRAKSGPQKSNIALEIIREGRDYLDNKIESLRN
jgi:EAL domain-containing protein (putative c-di-GMP-specific phosphodiesterase class I)